MKLLAQTLSWLVVSYCGIAQAAHVDIAPYFVGRSNWTAFSEAPSALKTGSYDLTGGSEAMLIPDDRVFTGTAVNYATGPGWVSTIDPGWVTPFFEDEPSERYPAGTTLPLALGSLSYNVVVDPRLGRNLSYWDGTGTPSFGPVPDGEVLRIELASGAVTLNGGPEGMPGTQIVSSLMVFNFHQHWSQRLWGSASNDPGDMPTEGFYLFSVNAQVNSSSFGNLVSDPLYIIMAHGFEKYDYVDGNEILAPEMQAARDWVQSKLVVPEPSALLLGMSSMLGLAFRWRKQTGSVVS